MNAYGVTESSLVVHLGAQKVCLIFHKSESELILTRTRTRAVKNYMAETRGFFM